MKTKCMSWLHNILGCLTIVSPGILVVCDIDDQDQLKIDEAGPANIIYLLQRESTEACMVVA